MNAFVALDTKPCCRATTNHLTNQDYLFTSKTETLRCSNINCRKRRVVTTERWYRLICAAFAWICRSATRWVKTAVPLLFSEITIILYDFRLLPSCLVSANLLTHRTTSTADTRGGGLHKTAVGGGRETANFPSWCREDAQLLNSDKPLQALSLGAYVCSTKGILHSFWS